MDLCIKKDKCAKYSDDQQYSCLEVSIRFLTSTVWKTLNKINKINGTGVGVGVGVVVRGNPAMENKAMLLNTGHKQMQQLRLLTAAYVSILK